MTQHEADLRAARECVLHGVGITATVEARLTARGIDVPALEKRFISNQEFRL